MKGEIEHFNKKVEGKEKNQMEIIKCKNTKNKITSHWIFPVAE